MTSTPVRLRASATARASSAAPVAAVWAVLADPARWAAFHPCVQSVSILPADAAPAPSAVDDPFGGAQVAAGQRFRARLRLLPLVFPVQVDHVVERSAVAVSVQLVPGLVEQLEFLLMPSVTGGSEVTLRLTLHGPWALVAVGPRWLARSLSARLLARVAARERAAEPAAALT